MSRCCGTVTVIFLAATLNSVNAGGNDSLRYQDRGNRYEGVHNTPTAGLTIELLSAKVLHNEVPQTEALPPTYRLRFYLNSSSATPHILVRDAEDATGYQLDRVKPARDWTRGFGNVFEWPTSEVIAHFPRLVLDNLDVIVRLGRENPSGDEWVAPAILYYRPHPPVSITGYEFKFKTTTAARLTIHIERADRSGVATQPVPNREREWPEDIPLRVTWDGATASAGEYQLVVEGRVSQNADTFEQRVRFYHSPITGQPRRVTR